MKCPLILFLLIPLFCMRSQGQLRQGIQPSEVKGKLNRMPVNGLFSQMEGKQNLKGNATKFIHAGLEKQLHAVLAASGLNPPVGFEADANTSVSSYQPNLGDKRYHARLFLNFREYTKDKSGKISRNDEGPAYIKLQSNRADFMTWNAGFFNDVNEKLKIPSLFQRIPVTDSTADYIEYNFKNYPFSHSGAYDDFAIRVVGRNNKPPFVPFTRKEYLQYLIASKKQQIKNNEKQIADFKSQIVQSKNNLKEEVFKSSWKVIEEGITITQGQ
ncbi:MAG: hypothetical protein ACRDE2_17755, partial [Chitinophagaceae bacterium]